MGGCKWGIQLCRLVSQRNSFWRRETQFAGKLLSLVLVLVKHVTCNKKVGERVSTQRTLVIAGIIPLYLWDEISTKKLGVDGIFNKNGGLQVGDSVLQTRFAGIIDIIPAMTSVLWVLTLSPMNFSRTHYLS